MTHTLRGRRTRSALTFFAACWAVMACSDSPNQAAGPRAADSLRVEDLVAHDLLAGAGARLRSELRDVEDPVERAAIRVREHEAASREVAASESLDAASRRAALAALRAEFFASPDALVDADAVLRRRAERADRLFEPTAADYASADAIHSVVDEVVAERERRRPDLAQPEPIGEADEVSWGGPDAMR